MHKKHAIIFALIFLLAGCNTQVHIVLPEPVADEVQGNDTSDNNQEQSELIEVQTDAGEFDLIFDMVNPTIGYAREYVGQQDDNIYSWNIYKTTDGGLTWIPVLENVTNISDFYILDENRIWIVQMGKSVPIKEEGYDYALEYDQTYHFIFSADGGNSWTELSSITPRVSYKGGLDAVYFVDEQVGFASITFARGNGYSSQMIYRTEDGGTTWTDQGTVGCDGNLFGLMFLNPSVGWFSSMIFSDNITLCQTSDGGNTWSEQELPTPHDLPSGHVANLELPYFLDSDNGIIPMYYSVLEDNRKHKISFYRTRDGGNTWSLEDNFPQLIESANANVESEYPTRFDFVDDGTGWVLTSKSRLFKYNMLKNKWGQIQDALSVTGSSKRGQYISTIDFVSDKIGWAIAGDQEKRYLYKTEDGGMSWQVLDVQKGKADY